MRVEAIREHLKMLLRIRANWDWYMQFSSGFFAGKVRIVTRSSELVLNKQQLNEHIKRTKQNLERCL